MTIWVYEDGRLHGSPAGACFIATNGRLKAYGLNAHEAFWNLITKLRRGG